MDTKATQSEVRTANRKRITNTLFRQGPMTIQELTRQLDLSHGTVTSIVKELVDCGLVTRGDQLASSGGRPASNVTIVSDARCSIGISVSTNHVRLLLVNLGLEILVSEKHSLSLAPSPEYWLVVSDLLDGFIRAHSVDTTRLLGIGLSVQVPVDKNSQIFFMPGGANSELWNPEVIRSAFKYPIMINNDAKMACYAQLFSTNDYDDAVFLLLGSGVGGSIIMNHKVWDGGRKNAEFGHITVTDGGRLCSCGQKGCLGAYCSTRAITEQTGVSLKEFFDELLREDAAFEVIWAEYVHYLALGISNLHTVFDTRVIIGGEMSPYLGDYADEIKKLLGEISPFGENGEYLFVSEYGEYDSAMGAALVHIEGFING